MVTEQEQERHSFALREAADEVHRYIQQLIAPYTDFRGHEFSIQQILSRHIAAAQVRQQPAAEVHSKDLAALVDDIMVEATTAEHDGFTQRSRIFDLIAAAMLPATAPPPQVEGMGELLKRIERRKHIAISDSADGMGPAIRLNDDERAAILSRLRLGFCSGLGAGKQS